MQSIDNATMDLMALNIAEPLNSHELTPFEALHELVFTVSGIPITRDKQKCLVSREWFNAKKFKDATIVNKDNKTACPNASLCFGENSDAQTRLERKFDKNWLEKQ